MATGTQSSYIPYSRKIWWSIKFDEFTIDDACVKLILSILANTFTSATKFVRFFLTLHHQKSAVYKAPLVCPVVNQKNNVLLQLLYILYFPLHWLNWYSYTLLIGLCLTTLILSTPSYSFHYHYSIMIMLIYFLSLALRFSPMKEVHCCIKTWCWCMELSFKQAFKYIHCCCLWSYKNSSRNNQSVKL